MHNILSINSLQNPKIKNIIKLRNRRQRDKQKTMIIEGYRCLLRSWQDINITTLYICPKLFYGENEFSLIEKIANKGATIFEVTPEIFKKISYKDRPEGLLGLASYLSRSIKNIKLKKNNFLAIAQSIEKPGNLGSIIRSADASGTNGLIVCDRCTDLFNPNVITASTGICFSYPVVESTTKETLEFLTKNNITIISTTPNTETLYNEVDLTGNIAIVIGSEQYGLTEDWLNHSSINVRIPMLGKADSLNVATATTILFYEALRQRQLSDKK